MLTYSDNAAANGTETYFGGSTSGGSALVNSLMRSVGLVDTEMYGGYELDALGQPQRFLAGSGAIPLRVDSQPSWGIGKKSSAYDLASLMRDVWLASGGRGPLRAAQSGFTPADARYLLYLLAHVRDPGKIDREVGKLAGVRVLHKAGWINVARHDNGIVLWQGGALVVTVMTYRPGRRRDRVRCARGQGRLGRSAPLPRLIQSRPEHTVGARMRAPTMFAVTPSECATAVGVRSREAIFGITGLQKLRLWAAAGVCTRSVRVRGRPDRGHGIARHVGPRHPREYRYSFCS